MDEENQYSDRDGMVTLILSILLGWLGFDRFYVGKVGTGILKLLVTLISFGTLAWIWWLIDLILLVTKNFRDDKGKVVKL